MKRPFIILSLALLTLSAILGWFKASGKSANQAVVEDRWAQLVQNEAQDVDIAQLNKTLKAMDVFPLTSEKALAATGPNGELITEGSDRPPFPKIINVSYLDNKTQLVLLLEDNSLIAAYEGETMESGWQLKTVDLTRVIAVFDGEEQEFPVTEYDNREPGAGEQGSEDL